MLDVGHCSKLFLTAMMDRLEDDTKKGMGQFTQEEGRVSERLRLSCSSNVRTAVGTPI